MPVDRRQKVNQRVRETIAAMTLEELRIALQMTHIKLAESLDVNQSEVSLLECAFGVPPSPRRQVGDPGCLPGSRNAHHAV